MIGNYVLQTGGNRTGSGEISITASGGRLVCSGKLDFRYAGNDEMLSVSGVISGFVTSPKMTSKASHEMNFDTSGNFDWKVTPNQVGQAMGSVRESGSVKTFNLDFLVLDKTPKISGILKPQIGPKSSSTNYAFETIMWFDKR